MSTIWQNVTTETGAWRIALYGDIASDTESGRTVAIAEPVTEDGKIREVTVNGVTYSGSVYFMIYHTDMLVMSTRHLTRYNDRARRWDPISPAARKRIESSLEPHIRALLADADLVQSQAVSSVRDEYQHALVDINRDIDKANKIAARLRDLGQDVVDLPRHKIGE